ncbi:hypothetical protein [Bradyrhizobium sp. 604_D8_N2_3]|uniref:hypothetical protein n=1 Tax=Bradyrhizobium sp. 604_D8_N2_3 TaxID=3240370 RepID=UPI003F247FA4
MFKGLLRASKDHWKFSGYWAEVIICYGKLTGSNLEQLTNSSEDRDLLNHFCRRAMDKRIPAVSCAQIIIECGFNNAKGLDDFQLALNAKHDLDELGLAFDATEQSEAESSRSELSEFFKAIGIDFMQLHPIVHNVLIREAIMSGAEATVEEFISAAQPLEQRNITAEEKANLLIEIYEGRAKELTRAKREGKRQYKISNKVRATLVQSPPELPSEERQQPRSIKIAKLDSEGKKALLHEMSDTLLSFMLWQDSELDKIYAERDLSEFESKELVFLYDATRALYQDKAKEYALVADDFSILFVHVAFEFCDSKDVEPEEKDSISLYHNVRGFCEENDSFLSAADALRDYVAHGERAEFCQALARCFE